MNVPNWYEAIILALAAWRIFQLVSEDDILDRPRAWALRKLPGKWDEFIECPFCAGFWVSLGVYLLWLWKPEIALAVGIVSGLNVAVILGNRYIAEK